MSHMSSHELKPLNRNTESSEVNIGVATVGTDLPGIEETKSIQMRIFDAIKSDDWTKAIWIIDTNAESFGDFTSPENELPCQNILQYACNIDDEKEAGKIVNQIFEIAERYPYTSNDIDDFVNHCGPDGQTALHIAICNGYKHVVKSLIEHGADVNLKETGADKDALHFIHDRLHQVMLGLFDDGLKIEKGKFDSSNELLWSLKCDFTSITGIKSRRDTNYNELCETNLLATVLRHPKVKRSNILLHPLVQTFIHVKGERFKWFIWLSVFYHVIWSLVSVTFIVHNAQFLQVWTDNISSNESCQHEEIPYSLPRDFFYPYIYIIAWIFYVVSFTKEIMEVSSCPSRSFYLMQYENIGQWILLIIFTLAWFLPLINVNAHGENSWLNAAISTMYIAGIVTALLLIQGQTTKLEGVGIYNQMLRNSFNRFLYFFAAFSPMLLAFGFTFFLLIHQKPEFGLDRGLGLTKILVMLTGELEYNDIFHGEDSCLAYPVATKLVLLFFVVTVVILLQNLLVGLTVEDVEKMRVECLISHLDTRLEVINLIDQFLTSRLVLKGLGFIQAENIVLELLIEPNSILTGTNSPDCDYVRGKPVITVHLSDLPEQLQNTIKSKYSEN